MYAFLINHMRATFPAHLILRDLIFFFFRFFPYAFFRRRIFFFLLMDPLDIW
jgi:hypothetical protein